MLQFSLMPVVPRGAGPPGRTIGLEKSKSIVVAGQGSGGTQSQWLAIQCDNMTIVQVLNTQNYKKTSLLHLIFCHRFF